MTKHWTGVIALLCSVQAGWCQSPPRIDTDRPDQTESAQAVPFHYLQAELGFNRENNGGGNIEWVHPTLLLKYGLKKWELRLETCARSFIDPSRNGKTLGWEPPELGCKVALLQEKGWQPTTSLIVHIPLPGLASKTYRGDNWIPSARLAMQHSITDNLGLGCNLGFHFDQPGAPPQWLYTFSPGMEFGKIWYGYVEAFGGIRRNESPEHSLAAGLACYLNKDWKLDVSGAIAIGKAAPPNYIAIGLSFRLPTKGAARTARRSQ